ncbi:kinase-like domain-containing protein [Xylaria bambusicola]|uniref:kinase-like domain-containing protein n=1 Tax=Xylaria bambusicola TaxID=326684 RepID=UPI002007734E|nr:kinase-like domain-containing protein [Xylaria bambusicola]KAI0522258.1 kinase-like domain-containing protein [Xylaria bambusicola]
MASFRFKSYLQLVDPASRYSITKLSGGLVNLTVRASKTTASEIGSFPGSRSLVLKYAPPFVAAIGPEAPFSSERQEVEASALKLFDDDGPLAGLRERTGIRIPKVLHHNVKSSVLIIEDLGPLVTLWDFLSPRAFEGNDLADNRIAEVGRAIGKRVGEFFAMLHSTDTVEQVKYASKSNPDIAVSVQQLSHSLTKGLVFDVAVKPIRERLATDDAGKLYEVVLSAFNQHSPPDEGCFSLGDCHPGAILLSSWDQLVKDHSDFSPEASVAVIDWEFSEIAGRGVDGDIAQFLACLHCHWLYLEALLESVGNDPNTSSKARGTHKALICTEAFVRGLCLIYPEVSSDPLTTDGMLRHLRSTVILLGRETINQAYEFAWDLEGYAVSKDELRNKMVMAGTDYLRKAGKDEAEALEIWLSTTEAKGIILTLFCLP